MRSDNSQLTTPFIVGTGTSIYTISELLEGNFCVLCKTMLYSSLYKKMVKKYFVIRKEGYVLNYTDRLGVHTHAVTDFYTTKKDATNAAKARRFIQEILWYASRDPIIISIESFFKI